MHRLHWHSLACEAAVWLLQSAGTCLHKLLGAGLLPRKGLREMRCVALRAQLPRLLAATQRRGARGLVTEQTGHTSSLPHMWTR